MAGMYEKLGDLLNETLEAGHVKFVHIEKEDIPPDGTAEEAGQEASGTGSQAGESGARDGAAAADRSGADAEAFARSFYHAEAEAEKRYFKTSRNSEGDRNDADSRDSGSRGRRVIYRRITPELEKALSLLGLDSTADKEAVRKAYKEKLLYYHPDRYAGKAVMEKVANDKTREVVAAYKLLMESLFR